MSTTIYGIKNCSTMKKTFDWFDARDVDYVFHDYRKAGIDPTTLERWCEAVGWEALLNRRGTTWRKLDANCQRIEGQDSAIALMLAHPALIRRPVLETGDRAVLVGFDPGVLATRFPGGAGE